MWTGNIPMCSSDTLKTKANEVWNLIDPDQGGPNTFSVPCVPTGSSGPTATDWGTATLLERECYDALKGTLQPDGSYVPLTNAEFTAFLQMRRAKYPDRPIPSNANSFRPQFKIGVEGQDFDEFLAENGLKRVAEAAAKK